MNTPERFENYEQVWDWIDRSEESLNGFLDEDLDPNMMGELINETLAEALSEIVKENYDAWDFSGYNVQAIPFQALIDHHVSIARITELWIERRNKFITEHYKENNQ